MLFPLFMVKQALNDDQQQRLALVDQHGVVRQPLHLQQSIKQRQHQQQQEHKSKATSSNHCTANGGTTSLQDSSLLPADGAAGGGAAAAGADSSIVELQPGHEYSVTVMLSLCKTAGKSVRAVDAGLVRVFVLFTLAVAADLQEQQQQVSSTTPAALGTHIHCGMVV